MVALSAYPALVLNADYQPLSYYPLSLWGWQDTIKAIFLDRVAVVSHYDQVIHSPGCEFRLPSVVALKQYIPQDRRPPFTRFNVFLRDRFACQYCRRPHPTPELTFDHVVPKSRGGRTSLGQHRHRLHPLQPAQGQPPAARMRHAAGRQAGGADGAPAAPQRPDVPAELPAPVLARLSLLGRRAGSVAVGGLRPGRALALPHPRGTVALGCELSQRWWYDDLAATKAAGPTGRLDRCLA